jgi:hypothetical protein|tara:strand:+ start:1142 stop:1315 length:174 start_codon:yes stop_codon:yes gene_type:complete
MEFWKHPTQGKIWTGDFKKHPEKKDEMISQGWERVKSRDDWSSFKKAVKKRIKKKKK